MHKLTVYDKILHGDVMKHIFIVNPEAGKGKALSEIKPQIEQVLSDLHDIDYEIYITKAIGDAEIAVRNFCENAKENIRIYACGGDGTLNEVANGIKGFENVELGCIPVGTGNDFVRNFAHKEFFSDIKKQISGKSVSIDLMKCNDKYSINMLNIGFDSNVAAEASRLKKTTFLSGFMAYIGGIVVVFKNKYGFKVSVKIDDNEETTDEMLLCAFANGGFCGGGFHSSLSASLNDGLIDAYLIHKISKLKFITLLPGYRTGKYIYTKRAQNCVDHIKCKKVHLKAYEEFKLCNDGEITNEKEIDISIEENAIKFIIPDGCSLVEPKI